jgi:hypothetical protein
MKRNFWNVVPRAVRKATFAIVGLVVLLGLIAGLVYGPNKGQPLLPLAGVGGGFILGSLIAIWVLCLGYVFADAQRRAMPPIPWTLIAAFVPNLLGFLFYFALRRPLLVPCPRCGQAIYTGQRFCASCGFDTVSSAPSTAPAPPIYPGGLGSNPV